jgi:hypothetical protein
MSTATGMGAGGVDTDFGLMFPLEPLQPPTLPERTGAPRALDSLRREARTHYTALIMCDDLRGGGGGDKPLKRKVAPPTRSCACTFCVSQATSGWCTDSNWTVL